MWLPWSAAIAAGALPAAGLLSLLLDFRTAFPYALGLSALVGVGAIVPVAPVALHEAGQTCHLVL